MLIAMLFAASVAVIIRSHVVLFAEICGVHQNNNHNQSNYDINNINRNNETLSRYKLEDAIGARIPNPLRGNLLLKGETTKPASDKAHIALASQQDTTELKEYPYPFQVAEPSSGSDSLTTNHDGSAIGAESDFVKSSKTIDGVDVDNNKDGSNERFVTQQVLSPYSAYKKNATHAPRFAYAYVISGCNEGAPHRNYLYDISISTYLQREAGSTADVVVFIQMAYESKLDELVEQDRNLLDAMNIYAKYIPKTAEESFYRTMLDKFHILGLVQYERVLFMDGDILARGNLDYLFDLSVRGILKRNIVTAGKTEPANGGFFMLAPTDNATGRMMAIISDKEARAKKLPYPHWDETVGWGHKFEEGDFARFKNGRKIDKWNFYGAFADQGIISIAVSMHFSTKCRLLTLPGDIDHVGLLYHWVKYEEKSVSIVHPNSVENWDVDRNGTLFIEQNLGMDIFKEYNFDRICWKIRPCKTPFKDFIHFTGRSKPWLVSPPEGFETDTTTSPSHFWYNTLYVLNKKMKLGIDFSQWRQFHRPLHGLYPKHGSVSKTSYAHSQSLHKTDPVDEKR